MHGHILVVFVAFLQSLFCLLFPAPRPHSLVHSVSGTSEPCDEHFLPEFLPFEPPMH